MAQQQLHRVIIFIIVTMQGSHTHWQTDEEYQEHQLITRQLFLQLT